MNGDSPCFSRKSDEWGTPQAFFDKLAEEFKFVFDAAASEENCKCKVWSGDSLDIDWYKLCGTSAIWLNPPYSRVKEFMKKAYDESRKGARIVCLIPSRTDTKYWHDYVMKSSEIRFVKGRLKFEGSEDTKSCAPFPSCVVIFDGPGEGC